LKIVSAAGEYIEGTPGGDVEQWGKCPVAEHFAHKSAASQSSCLIDAAEDEAVALVEQ
jgi:hypothetical protein